MKRLLAVTVLAVLFWACPQNGPGPPPFDIDQVAPLIAELQLAEALTGEVPVLVRDSMREVYMQSILSEHGLNQEEFDSLMWIVRQEPVWIDSVYSRAGEIISRMQVAEKEVQ